MATVQIWPNTAKERPSYIAWAGGSKTPDTLATKVLVPASYISRVSFPHLIKAVRGNTEPDASSALKVKGGLREDQCEGAEVDAGGRAGKGR